MLNLQTANMHQRILRDWTEMLPQFVKVMPIDYRKALERLRKAEVKRN